VNQEPLYAVCESCGGTGTGTGTGTVIYGIGGA